MAINLSNLNISLDKFNAASGGEYNIGQMKLSSDGKSVYRANNHKTWTIFNWTKISSKEALAVKFAFCKALAKEGLSQKAITEVKAKLGIPGDTLDALKAGNIKPLTAAEVREVIDKYAGQINQNRASAANGAKALKTSDDLYRGVGGKKMENRAATRNEINAASIGKMMTGTDKAVNNLLDMLQFGEKGKDEIKYAYMLSFGKDGALDIECKARQDGFNTVMLFGGSQNGGGTVVVMPGKDSKVEATMDLKIDAAELDRLSGIDFSKYDAEGVKAKFEDPNVQNRYSDRTMLGEDFMIDDAKVTCTSTYKMTVN